MHKYLIAIGTLRALYRHGITEARIRFDGNGVMVSHEMSPDDYMPPAVASPWNGRWHHGAGLAARNRIMRSTDVRLEGMREAITTALRSCEDDREKAQQIAWLRSNSPAREDDDDLAAWVDACWQSPDTPVWLAGTGGNWGSADMSVTAMHAALELVEAVDPPKGAVGGRKYSMRVYGGLAMTAMEYLLAIEGLIALRPTIHHRTNTRRWMRQPMRSASAIGGVSVASERTIGSYWLPRWGQLATYQEFRQLIGGMPGWLNDSGAARWVARGAGNAGVHSYRRWQIMQGDGGVSYGASPN